MKQKQLDHNEVTLNKYNFSTYVLCDNIRSPENTGMIFRVSEAFGVQKIHFTNTSPKTDNARLKRAARNTHRTIKHEYSENLKDVIIQLRKDGFIIIGIEITNTSKVINESDFTPYEKIALVVGAEKSGVSTEILALLDYCVHIPMFGKNSSMNVVNALAISLYEISTQLINRVL